MFHKLKLIRVIIWWKNLKNLSLGLAYLSLVIFQKKGIKFIWLKTILLDIQKIIYRGIIMEKIYTNKNNIKGLKFLKFLDLHTKNKTIIHYVSIIIRKFTFDNRFKFFSVIQSCSWKEGNKRIIDLTFFYQLTKDMSIKYFWNVAEIEVWYWMRWRNQ